MPSGEPRPRPSPPLSHSGSLPAAARVRHPATTFNWCAGSAPRDDPHYGRRRAIAHRKASEKKIILVIFSLILYSELGNYFLEKHLARLLFETVILQRPAHAEQESLLIREFLALGAKSFAPPAIALLGNAPHFARIADLPRRHGNDLVAVCLQRQALLGVRR